MGAKEEQFEGLVVQTVTYEMESKTLMENQERYKLDLMGIIYKVCDG